MSRLDEAAKSVPAGSSPADEEFTETTDDLDLDASASGEEANDEDESGEKKERSVENVRGELLRKMEKSQQAMMEKLEAITTENKTLRDQLTAAPATKSQSPKTFDDMSVDELIQHQDSIPEAQRKAFDLYLMDRKIDERADQRFGELSNKNDFKEQEDKFNQQAYERWPQLRQKSSEFYGIADRVLSGMGKSGDKNPRAVLDAANEAGLELGLAPDNGVRRSSRRSPGNVAPGRSTRGTDAPDVETTAEDAAIAKKLANAMPGKKFSEKQLKRIAKRSKMYKDSVNNHLRG